MPKDNFDPDGPLPRFLVEQEEQPFGDYRDEGVMLSRLFKASLLIAAVAVTGIAFVAFGNPVALITDATASLMGSASPQPAADQQAPVVQSADAPALKQALADAQVPPPPANDAPAQPLAANDTPAAPAPFRQDVAAADLAGSDQNKDQAPPGEPSSDALFKQFQSWLVQQDAQGQTEQAKAEPAPPTIAAPAPIMQETPVSAADDVPVAHPPLPKRRHVPAVHDAQADPHAPNARKPTPRTQEAHGSRPPGRAVQDARAQEAQQPPPQPQPAAQAPLFSSIFGGRN